MVLNLAIDDLLSALPAGVIILNDTGTIVEANPAAKKLIGEPLLEIPWIQVIKRAFAPKIDDGHEVSLKDGRLVKVDTRPLEIQGGQVIVLTDMTETRELQRVLSRYQRLSEMGRMVASLAHQIRTPVSTAFLYARHLQKPDLDSEKRLKFAHKIHKCLHHIETQISDMLTFAQGGEHVSAPFTIEELLGHIIKQIESTIIDPHIQFDVDNQLTEQTTILGNIDALSSAIQNLINNAAQSTRNNIQIYLRAQLTDNKVNIQVQDTGPGMPPEVIEKVLEPFYTTKTHGTGLGLPVVQAVASAHQGEFVLQSEPDVGTLAILKIPVYEKP